MAREEEDPTPSNSSTRTSKAHLTLLLLSLPPYTIHFKSPHYLQPSTLDLLDKKVAKQILRISAETARVRETIGGDERYWREMVELVGAGVRGVEGRSFQRVVSPTGGDGGGGGGWMVDYEAMSGALIASHYPSLWRDIERLNTLLSISRNVLTSGAATQDLAASHAVEQQIFRLINVCVRVTARGYDGDAGTGEEEKWQWVVNAYKKLLITGLQWLNNFVAGNEGRKLLLWVALFDNDQSGEDFPEQEVNRPSSADEKQDQPQHEQVEEKSSPQPKKPTPPITTNDILLAYGTNGSSRISPLEMEAAIPIYSSPPDRTHETHPPQYHGPQGFKPMPSQITALIKKNRFEPNGYVYFTAQKRALTVKIYQQDHSRSPTLGEIHRAMPVLWEQERTGEGIGGSGKGRSEKKVWESWQGAYDRAVTRYREDVGRWEKGLPALGEEEKEGKKVMVEDIKKEEKREVRISEEEKVDMFDKVRALEQEVRQRLKIEFEAAHLDDGPSQSETTTTTTGTAEAGFTERNQTLSILLDKKLARSLLLSSSGKDGSEEEYTRMHFSAQAGAKILESGKAELMKRLEGYDAADDDDHDDEFAGNEGGSGENRVADIVAVRTRRRRRRSNRRRGSRRSVSDAFAAASAVKTTTEGGGASLHSEDDDGGRDEEEGFGVDVRHIGDSDSQSDDDDEDEEDHDDDEEDYPGSSEDGRGLLTDVPLILGPSEIEVLPMLVMSGIVSSSTSNDNNPSAASLTTHLLLTRTSGRNLLRELLIFVAAWDLREEELYFKFMLQITERILECGLMPYAYHCFRDRSRSKDIISPAQAVVMKLLTCIFRGRGGSTWEGGKEFGRVPQMVELHVLNFIFMEFRQHIIPQTCALIFLQGQIHRGGASPEDFPLNLWDMERMYEGVYQFLEFFAVLAEEQQQRDGKLEELGIGSGGGWKGILAEWEMASELVTLLRELESGIPKASSAAQQQGLALQNQMAAQKRVEGKPIQDQVKGKAMPPELQRSLSADAVTMGSNTGAAGRSVERPFDLDDAALPPLPSTNSSLFEPDTHTLPYSEDGGGINPNLSSAPEMGMGMGMDMHDQDEPSDFEWRNLKKLTVLVLSSLIWKNRKVQDQVRECGGLEALVGCCRPDEHNPYIREHAIMCLRFAVEGCEENAQVIRGMVREYGGDYDGGLDERRLRSPYHEGVEGVPKEVLDTHGYETFMDSKGQVGLRRKVDKKTAMRETAYLDASLPLGMDRSGTASAPPGDASSSSSSAGNIALPPPPMLSTAATTKMTAEKAAELMQNALRDLPLGDKLVTDRQKAEALARLDRAFESTEKALGRDGGGSGSGSG